MKALATITAASLLLAGQAMADTSTDHLALYGIVLSDASPASAGTYEPTGHITGMFDMTGNHGNVLFDLDQPSPQTVASTPSIGDSAYDYGNILYDTGSVY